MLMIYPKHFLHVEHGTAFVNARDGKFLDELLKRKYLLLGTRIPAEKCKVIHKCLGQEALQAVLIDRYGSVPFGQF